MRVVRFLVVTTAFGAVMAFGQLTASRAEVTVKVAGFKNDHGVARVYLFHNQVGWPLDFPLATKAATVPIKNREATAVIGDVAYGVYAVVVIHDENDDGAVNVNFFKVRTEGWGFSRNEQALTQAPGFDDARVEIYNAHVKFEISMQY